jgi:hypothetical protein
MSPIYQEFDSSFAQANVDLSQGKEPLCRTFICKYDSIKPDIQFIVYRTLKFSN